MKRDNTESNCTREGEVVRTWETDDNVFWNTSSGYIRFTDKATGKLVNINGPVVLTKED